MTQSLARGACPSLEKPMAVADGLLARFRPVDGFSPDAIAALAEAAEAFGNGRIEVTARGNVQVRGLTPGTEQGFRAALDAGRIAIAGGVAIDCSPIAGLDPTEIADPRPLAARLQGVCDAALARGALSPKLSIVLISGGQIPLDAHKADIRLTATPEGWALEVGNSMLGLLPESAVPDAVASVLGALQGIGPRARGGDLDAARIADAIAGLAPFAPLNLGLTQQGLGPLGLKSNAPALRIGLPFGQIRAWQAGELARIMEAHGVSEARPAPDRSFVLLGFDAAALRALSPALASAGYWTRPDAPGANVSLCSGAEASGGGIIHAADLAQAFHAAGPGLLDGSFHIHVSTCAKGCAHAGRPGIVLSGNALRLYRRPAQKPFASLDPAAIEAAIVHLAGRIRDARQPGETVLEAFGRLGAP